MSKSKQSKRKTGYIVLNGYNTLLMYARDPYYEGMKESILVFGDTGTIFKSRKSADRAVKNTAQYAESNGLANWEVEKFSTIPVCLP